MAKRNNIRHEVDVSIICTAYNQKKYIGTHLMVF